MLYQLPSLHSRAASAENPLAERSAGRRAGGGRKGAPCLVDIQPGETRELMSARGPGVVRHIWMTFPPNLRCMARGLVLRAYWDGQDTPSVEAPVGDFFGIAHARLRPMVSELTAFQGGRGLNCWAPMPFRESARITIENDSGEPLPMLFYQVDFTLGDALGDDAGYFHAQFRRANLQPIHTDYVVLDNVKGPGRYLGTVLGVRSACAAPGWWGEGEFKFFLDGEAEPTICGTGIEDYFGFAWGVNADCTPRQGCTLADGELGLYSMYRWHTVDPICFEDGLRVTVQQIGYGSASAIRPLLDADFVYYQAAGRPEGDDMCYYDRDDDYCSTAYWYQRLPTAPFPPLPGREARLADLMLDRDAGIGRRDV